MPDDTDDRDESGLTPAERRILQTKADKAEELQNELDNLRRQVAIRDTELDLNETQMRALQSAHQGEWTKDALLATASQLGWGPAQPPPVVTSEEAAANQRVLEAASGATVTPTDLDKEFDAKAAQLRADVKAGRLSPQVADQQYDAMYRSKYPDRVAIN